MLWPSWIVLLSQRCGVHWSISLLTLSDMDLRVHLSICSSDGHGLLGLSEIRAVRQNIVSLTFKLQQT